MFILTLFYLFKDLQCVNWRSSAQLGEAILKCLMTKQVQKQGTLPCHQKSVLVFLSCTHILFYKQTLLAMTGSKVSHSHHGNACSLCILSFYNFGTWLRTLPTVTWKILVFKIKYTQGARLYAHLWQVCSLAVESSFFLPPPHPYFSLVVFTVTEMEKTY